MSRILLKEALNQDHLKMVYTHLFIFFPFAIIFQILLKNLYLGKVEFQKWEITGYISINLFCFPLVFWLFSKRKILNPQHQKLLKVTKFFCSLKTQKDTFEPIIADWQEEYFEALFKKEIWKARWLNVRYTYAFIVAMWQKSPIGDLIEFVKKIAK